MFAFSFVIFRELLEIVLMLCIVMSAVKEIPNKNKYLGYGIVFGVVLSLLLMTSADFLDETFEGVGQEVINGFALLITSVMMGTTIIWMNKNAIKETNNIKNIARDIKEGQKKPWNLSFVIGMIIFRELAEIMFYTSSIVSASKISLLEVTLGSCIATISALSVGLVFYFGSSTLLRQYLFPVSNWLIILIAANLSAEAAANFVAAGYLPEIIGKVWDITDFTHYFTHILSFIGINDYIMRPSLLELIFFTVTFTSILFFIRNNKVKN